MTFLHNEGLPFVIQTRIVVVDGGQETREVVMDAPVVMVTATARKR